MPLALDQLPDIQHLRRRCQALAMVEAIVSPEWDSRYYSFNASWSSSEQMASMRNGEGDDWFILFGPPGVGVKGRAHGTASACDPRRLASTRQCVPATLASFLEEPAFNWNEMSFCYWRETGDPCWHRVAPPTTGDDGSEDLLALLLQPASSYVEFAAWYYEAALPHAIVEAIYAHQPLTQALVTAINPGLALEDVQADAREIGFPVA